MDLGSAQFFRGNVLPQDRLDHPRTGQAEEGVLGLNDEAPLTGEVTAAAGVEAEHAHDGRDDTADFPECSERLGIAVEAAYARRDEGAGAVVHADQGNPLFAGHVHEPGQLVAVGGIDRAGPDREVVTVEGHVTPPYAEYAGDQRSPVQILAPVLEQNIGVLVGENADSLPDGHPLLEVLLFDLADADRFNGALNQVVPFLHRLFIAAGRPGNFPGDVEVDFLGRTKRVFQRRFNCFFRHMRHPSGN